MLSLINMFITGPYDTEKELCCDAGPIQHNTNTEKCCGTGLYDSETQGCCGKKSYNISTQHCCLPSKYTGAHGTGLLIIHVRYIGLTHEHL